MADSSLMTGEELVIVFDFDGIITTLDIDWTALRYEISSKLGLEIENFAIFFKESYGTGRFEEVSNLVKEREMSAAREAVPFPDVDQALRLIQTKVMKSHVASMQSKDVLEYFLQRHDLRSRFREVLGREDGGSKRVQLEKIKALQETKGNKSFSLKKFVLIDDVSRNIHDADRLGYHGILYQRKLVTKSLTELVSELIGK